MSMLYLNLPSSSDAFTSFATPARTNVEDHPPPRKIARREGDDAGRARTEQAKGPIRTTISLDSTKKVQPERQLNAEFTDVRRSLAVLLTRGTDEAPPVVYERIFSACHSIVSVFGDGERLHGALRMELERCIGKLAEDISASAARGVEWLEVFNDAAAWFQNRVALIQSLLTYLDRVYLLKDPKSQSIRDLAYGMFTNRVLDYRAVVTLIQTAIREWAAWERAHSLCMKALAADEPVTAWRCPHTLAGAVKALVGHLVAFDRYTQVFETAYLASTEAFYAQEAAEYAASLRDRATKYFAIADARIAEEEARCGAVAHGETCGLVANACLVTFLEKDRLVWLTTETLEASMPDQNEAAIAQLHDTFRLVERVGALPILAAAFKNHVQNDVERIVKDAAHDDTMIERLVALKAFAGAVATRAFQPGTPVPGADFEYGVRAAFQGGFKARRQRPAELLAKALDRMMRRGQRGAGDAAHAAAIDALLSLHRFTDDKDVFRTFYHRLLAKRLLLERSASDDFEKSVIKKLNDHYDPEFHMGEHMFKDLTLSRDLMLQYRGHTADAAKMKNETVMVLQRSFWPFSARKEDIKLPDELQAELEQFVGFYKAKFKGRKLEFDHALGSATLRTHFRDNKVREITVSLYQAAVLLQFNDAEELTFKDIKAATRMEDSELRRTLQSLALGKKRVLTKRAKGKDVRDDDVFAYNADFTDTSARVHIPSIQAQETPEENTRTAGAIQAERGYTLDAAIVRIMKAKRKLHYEALKAAVVDAVKGHFVPDVALIKKRISDLVEQDYMERDEDDMNVYSYVA